MARSTVRFGSESPFGLTQSSFLSSKHGPRLDLACSSARFARSPAQLKARRIAARLGSLFGTRRISARGLGSAGDSGISLMLGLAQLGARLGVQLEAQLGIGWEIGFGLAWLRAQLGSLVSAWCLGSARGSARLGSQVRLDVRPASICIPNAIFEVSSMR